MFNTETVYCLVLNVFEPIVTMHMDLLQNENRHAVLNGKENKTTKTRQW